MCAHCSPSTTVATAAINWKRRAGHTTRFRNNSSFAVRMRLRLAFEFELEVTQKDLCVEIEIYEFINIFFAVN